MPATPYAKLFVSINSGALADGGITAAVSDTVDQSAESTVGWPVSGAGAPRWEIYGYPPSFAEPAGYETDATTGAYYYLGTSPPQFTLTHWGKYMLRLLVQGGGGDKTDESTAITVPDTTGLQDLGYRETSQFNAGWDDDQRANLRIIATGLGVAKAPANAQYLVGAAHADLSAEVVWTTIATTVAFASTATQPCTFSRTDTSVTNAALTARTLIALGGTVANGFGVAEVYQAEGAGGTAIDAGSLACCWTDITGASEDAEWVLRARKAGAALTDASTVAARISPLAVTLPALAGVGTRAVTTDANGLLATAALASAAALYLEDATSAVTTNGRPIRNLAAALDFNRANGLPVTAANTLATSGTKIPLFSFRRLTGGVGATNDGGYISFTIPDSGSAETEAARLGWSWQNVTGTYGEVTLGVRNNLGLATQYTFDSGGKLTTTNLAATGLSAAGLVTNSAAGLLSTSATAVLINGTVPANLTAGINVAALSAQLQFNRTDEAPLVLNNSTTAAPATVVDALALYHLDDGGAGAVNGGVGVGFWAYDTPGDTVSIGRVTAKMTDATSSAHASEVAVQIAVAGALTDALVLSAAETEITADVTTWIVGRSAPYNGGDATGAVTLDFSRSNVIEVSALVDNVTFTITGAVRGANYTVVVRQHASAAKTTTWASGLFASGDDAIGTTVNTYTAWQFVVTDAGTIVCVNRKADIVIP